MTLGYKNEDGRWNEIVWNGGTDLSWGPEHFYIFFGYNPDGPQLTLELDPSDREMLKQILSGRHPLDEAEE